MQFDHLLWRDFMFHKMVIRDVVLQLTHALSRPTPDPVEAFRYHRALHSLTRKASPALVQQLGETPTVDLAAAARDSFFLQEELNRETNRRIFEDTESFNARVVHSAGILIRQIIGSCPFDQLIDESGFGPGSMVGCSGERQSYARKFSESITYTAESSSLIRVLLEGIPAWQANDTRLVRGGEFFTVPKDSRTDRGCEKQPIGNLFLQKGAGSIMRKRMRRYGIDLSDQTINQRRAYQASLTNEDMTWDGRNASNSLTYWLIRECLWAVPDWLWLLDSIRTHRVLIDGRYHELEMFSAMGNGFTFELESLVFYSLAKATADLLGLPGVVTVYGDDLIFPVTWREAIMDVFAHFGIQTNIDKSFHDGPFRESCGGDYYLGHTVTPLYLKREYSSLGSLIRLCNQIREVATKWGDGLYADSVLYGPWKFLADYISSHGGAYGPCNVDGVIHHDESQDGYITRNGYLRIKRTLVEQTKRHVTPEKGRCLASLWLLPGEIAIPPAWQLRLQYSSRYKVPLGESLKQEDPYTTVEEADTLRSARWRWKQQVCYYPEWAVPWI